MTKGRLGIIACPMLEDELINSLADDPEEKTVIVIRTPHDGSLKRKLDWKGVPYSEADEMDFQCGWLDIDPEAYTVIVVMNDLGLHAEPRRLRSFIEDQLVMMTGKADAVGLYYGMCGNMGWDISEWAKSRLGFPVTVFRDAKGRVCDDCIGVSVGGLDGYQRLLKTYTGELLLTPAVATNWVDFLSASDIAQGAKTIRSSGDPKKDIKDLFKLVGYKAAVQIDNHLEDEKEFDDATKDLVDYMEFELHHAPPDFVDLWPMRNMYEQCKRSLEGRGPPGR